MYELELSSSAMEFERDEPVEVWSTVTLVRICLFIVLILLAPVRVKAGTKRNQTKLVRFLLSLDFVVFSLSLCLCVCVYFGAHLTYDIGKTNRGTRLVLAANYNGTAP